MVEIDSAPSRSAMVRPPLRLQPQNPDACAAGLVPTLSGLPLRARQIPFLVELHLGQRLMGFRQIRIQLQRLVDCRVGSLESVRDGLVTDQAVAERQRRVRGRILRVGMVQKGGIGKQESLGLRQASAKCRLTNDQKDSTRTKEATYCIELPSQNTRPAPMGTGFFISPNGCFVTAAHVITESNLPNGPVRTDLLKVNLMKEPELAQDPLWMRLPNH